MDLLAGRVLVLATMHRKETAIAPILEQNLGVTVIVPQNFNTDSFGTFTREIPRPGTQLEAAQLKAKKALELTGETLAVASEGSFTPHPYFPSLAVNREIVFLCDRLHDWQLYGEAVSTQTNYNHRTVKTWQEALDFAEKVDFPSHGLIVMVSPNSKGSEEIFKGLTTPEQLKTAFNQALELSPNGQVHLETDMRAMYNPTRMVAIAQATENLVQKIQNRCPNCQFPGFEIIERRIGLPCELCQLPTQLVRSVLYGCQRCGERQEQLYPDGVKTADPSRCNYCNP